MPYHNLAGSLKKQESSRKNIYFCSIDYSKAFDCVDHNKLWKILKEMGISDHLTYFLRNLYEGQEATVRTGHGTTDSFLPVSSPGGSREFEGEVVLVIRKQQLISMLIKDIKRG